MGTGNPRWSWREGLVVDTGPHFDLRYGSVDSGQWETWLQVALVGPPQNGVFAVQFLVDRLDQDKASAVESVEQELDFYLIKKGEKNPWAYAVHHCGTAANVYSKVHWSFFPEGVRR